MKAKLTVIALYLVTLLSSPATFAAEGSSVVATYFHTTFRCVSCHKIQNFTEEALRKGFARELASGRLKYRVINIEEPGNEHYVQDYSLYTKSVVLSLQKDGKEVGFKNLDKVWQLLNDKDKFVSYIENETKSFLDSN
ncbi:MAG: nitrophenyl compound nitroreductase subunit ArsF family protein [Candidatus Zapsychrus exili]|nr:nitrophenyl compound nitroreductase subunit ArsF family protein [Candidatus Zapsychrus exili]